MMPSVSQRYRGSLERRPLTHPEHHVKLTHAEYQAGTTHCLTFSGERTVMFGATPSGTCSSSLPKAKGPKDKSAQRTFSVFILPAGSHCRGVSVRGDGRWDGDDC